MLNPAKFYYDASPSRPFAGDLNADSSPVRRRPDWPLNKTAQPAHLARTNSTEFGQQGGRRATRLTHVALYNFLRIR